MLNLYFFAAMACRKQVQYNPGDKDDELITVDRNANNLTESNQDNVTFTFSPPIEIDNYSESILKEQKECKGLSKKKRVKRQNRDKRWGRKMNRRERTAIKRAIEDLKRYRESESSAKESGLVTDRAEDSVKTTNDQCSNEVKRCPGRPGNFIYVIISDMDY